MKNFTALFLLCFVCVFGVLADNLPEEVKLQNIEKQLQESKQKLQKTKEEEQAVLGRLVVINKELQKTKQTLGLTQRKIVANEAQIGTLTIDLKKTDSDLQVKTRKFKERAREIYKSSGLNYFELIITSRSMSDFINRLYFFGKIVDFDANLVEEVRSDMRIAKQKREVLQDKTQEIRVLAKVIAEKKEEIASQAEEKNKVYEALKQRREEYEKQVAELEKSSKDLEVMILKKMAARRGGKVLGSGSVAWPLQGEITSRYGYRRHPLWGGRHFHTGLDIAAPYGSPIKSADAGEVIFAGWWDGYGKAIVVDHGHNTTTVYGHLSRIYKQVGAVVAKGQVIGLEGSTGYSTGPHLHFEVRKNGKPVNPADYLR